MGESLCSLLVKEEGLQSEGVGRGWKEWVVADVVGKAVGCTETCPKNEDNKGLPGCFFSRDKSDILAWAAIMVQSVSWSVNERINERVRARLKSSFPHQHHSNKEDDVASLY
jgi:hypothetical protein